MTDQERDFAVANSFETIPTERKDDDRVISPSGYWKWTSRIEWMRDKDRVVADRFGEVATVDNGSWRPVSATEPWVVLKCLSWLWDTLGEESIVTLWYGSCGDTLPSDIVNAYLTQRIK